MKIFRTRSAEVVLNCMLIFNCRSVLTNVNVNLLQIMLNLITYYIYNFIHYHIVAKKIS